MLLNIPEVSMTNSIHYYKPCTLWFLSRETPALTLQCNRAVSVLAKLYSFFTKIEVCPKCGRLAERMDKHLILFCPANSRLHYVLWHEIHLNIGTDNYTHFINTDQSRQILNLLIGLPMYHLESETQTDVHIFSLKIIYAMLNSG